MMGCNAVALVFVNPKNPSMPRLFICLSLAIACFCTACSKNDADNENIMYGTWVKGTHAGDTLVFMRKNGQDILKSNQSFNPNLPTYKESEFSYSNNKLSVALISSKAEISSFAWKQQGKVFELNGYELFPFMSSTVSVFTYTKVN